MFVNSVLTDHFDSKRFYAYVNKKKKNVAKHESFTTLLRTIKWTLHFYIYKNRKPNWCDNKYNLLIGIWIKSWTYRYMIIICLKWAINGLVCSQFLLEILIIETHVVKFNDILKWNRLKTFTICDIIISHESHIVQQSQNFEMILIGIDWMKLSLMNHKYSMLYCCAQYIQRCQSLNVTKHIILTTNK